MKTTISFRFLVCFLLTSVFALNSGSTEPFNPLDDSSVGTVKDIDGNVYKTVKIGSQVWMAENLKTTKYNDGTEIPNIVQAKEWENLSTGAYCHCWNMKKTEAKYGLLYNWYAVKTDKLAPSGWHVPTDAEWTILEDYLIANGYNYDGTTTDDKIAKSLAGTSYWQVNIHEGVIGNNKRKNNSTGFTALPGGHRSSEGFFGQPQAGFTYDALDAFWWSSSEYDASNAVHRVLSYNSISLDRFQSKKNFGFSVRCVKDSVSH